MIFSRATSPVNTSALAASVPKMGQITLPLPDHNAALPGDTLTQVALNFEWRRVVVHQVERLLDRSMYIGTEAEIDTAVQQVHALLSDMYTIAGIGGVMDTVGARASRRSLFTPAVGSWVVVPLDDPAGDAWDWDTDGFWDVANPERLTIPAGADGMYHVNGFALWQSGTFGNVAMRININGSVIESLDLADTAGWRGANCACTVPLVAGDYVRMDVNAGVLRTLWYGAPTSGTYLELIRVGDLP